MAAGGKGKGGNKGKPPKFSTKRALTPSGAYFSHEQPLCVPGTFGIPIRLKEKYLR